ncbi:hypothetical protein HDU92_006980, partial [Lobulomyces angularis]
MQSKIITAILLSVAVNASPAVICNKMMPTCDTIRCASGFTCQVLPQTELTCAKAECVA